MKKLLLIPILLLSACGALITPEQYKNAEELCSTLGGLRYVDDIEYLGDSISTYIVKCEDGSFVEKNIKDAPR